MDIELTPKVTTVTVYTEQALVTAAGHVSLPAGHQRLVVNDLPLSMNADSVRIGGEGEARVRLLGVEVRRQHYEETPAQTVRELEATIEQREDELQVIADEQAVLDAQGRYLEGLRGASEQYARGLALGRTKVDEQAAIGRSFQQQDQDLRASRRELEKEKRGLARSLDKARRELEQLQSARPTQRNRAIVDLDVLSSGGFDVELTYNVSRASWKPLYDLRLVETEGEYELYLEGLAVITQSSGQDWADVALKVSTARLDLNRRLPELKPWYLDIYTPPMPRVAPTRMAVAAAPQSMGEEPVKAERRAALETATAAVSSEEGGAIVTFDVSGRGNIPSDGSPHKTTLFQVRLPARVDYITIPRHTDAVFRRIRGVNSGPSPLLAGPMHLFVGQRFIGESHLEYVPTGDELELLAGVEERLAVERKLVRRDVDKRRLRDKRQIQYGYEIEIKNLLPGAAHVEVHDQVPVSRHEEITVKLIESAPEPTERSELNLMEWHFDLAAGMTQKLTYAYQVEHSRSLRITGLTD